MNSPVIEKQPSFDTWPQARKLPETITVEITPSPIKRTKIWDLNRTFHCPIIGICISTAELERFARRFHFDAPISHTHALHVEAVCRAACRNRFSEAIHKYLDKQYQGYIKQFESAKSDDEVLLLWQHYFSQGKIAGPLWAALTHKRIGDASQARIHDCIHMHMHQAVIDLASAQARLLESEQMLQETTGALEKYKQQHATRESRLRTQLNQALAEIKRLQACQQEAEMLRQRLEKLESCQAMHAMGQRLMRLTTENEQLRIKAEGAKQLDQAYKRAKQDLFAIQHQCDNLRKERDALEQLLLTQHADHGNDADGSKASATDDTGSCPCILCVGGKITLLPQYRALARQMGLELVHHDGGQEDALSRLPEMIYSAHAVICPTDCVSHAAYYQVKRLCRLSHIPCLLFKGMGVSSFATALTRITTGNTTIHGTAM